MSLSKKFINSFFEFKKTRSLAVIAMLLALRIVLGFFANGTLALFGNNIKISFAFLPIAVAGIIFGPVPASMIGAFGDIISFMLNPTGGAYFPGFTISGLLTGLIYGFALYENDTATIKVIVAWVINALTVETFIAAYWLFLIHSASSGAPYIFYLTARLISIAVKCVPEILLILGVGRLAAKINQNTQKKFKT